MEWGQTSLRVESLRLTGDQQLEPAIKKELSSLFEQVGVQLNDAAEHPIRFSQNKELSEEGYQLRITPEGIEIEASTQAGRFYALQSLRQLSTSNGSFQLAQISDAPAFAMRGFMLDVGRNYLSMELLKEQLDIMARYKLNVFQWHLTDYPAWRIQSHRYPQLTAAQNHRPTRDPGKFYTYDEIRELINYAKEKQILVIPEIDMPGHSESFVTATGHKMESPEGMQILKHVLSEFFEQSGRITQLQTPGPREVAFPDRLRWLPMLWSGEMIS